MIYILDTSFYTLMLLDISKPAVLFMVQRSFFKKLMFIMKDDQIMICLGGHFIHYRQET